MGYLAIYLGFDSCLTELSTFLFILLYHLVTFAPHSTHLSGSQAQHRHSGDFPNDKLRHVMVQDIARSDAFDKAVQSDPSCEIVVHTVSPFNCTTTGTKKDFLDPTVVVMITIKSMKQHAATVKGAVCLSLKLNLPGSCL